MTELLIFGGIIAALWIGLLLLRVPASIAFLSVLIGQLLVSQSSEEVFDFISAALSIDEQYVQMVLLLLPLLLTVLLLRNRVPSSKLVVEALPVLFVAALTVFLLATLLAPLGVLVDHATDDKSMYYQSIIAVAASVSGLLSAWFNYPKPLHKKGKHHK